MSTIVKKNSNHLKMKLEYKIIILDRLKTPKFISNKKRSLISVNGLNLRFSMLSNSCWNVRNFPGLNKTLWVRTVEVERHRNSNVKIKESQKYPQTRLSFRSKIQTNDHEKFKIDWEERRSGKLHVLLDTNNTKGINGSINVMCRDRSEYQS